MKFVCLESFVWVFAIWFLIHTYCCHFTFTFRKVIFNLLLALIKALTSPHNQFIIALCVLYIEWIAHSVKENERKTPTNISIRGSTLEIKKKGMLYNNKKRTAATCYISVIEHFTSKTHFSPIPIYSFRSLWL